MDTKPMVSIILPSYNHCKYISKAIDSVLMQDYHDYELLISDDASSDNSKEVIEKYNDRRIKIHYFKKNQGATLNNAYLLNQSKGKYIALINSDDIWLPHKLKNQVQHMENHPDLGACFTWAKLIDENGKNIKANALIFNQPNRMQGEWLEFFFTKGNCICHPSMLIKSEVYDDVGSYNLAMRQLPDFEMWVRLVKKYPIHIIQEVFVGHRRFILSGENTSTPTMANALRDVIESSFILSDFFENVTDDLFVEGFSKLFRKKGSLSHQELVCEKFFLMMDSQYYIKNIHIMTAIYYVLRVYNLPGVMESFRDSYHFTLQDFHQITGKLDLSKILPKEMLNASFLEFDIERYIKSNRARILSFMFLNKESKIYRFIKKAYFMWVLRK